MEKYIAQLLSDIDYATHNVSLPFAEGELHVGDWLTDEEEDQRAPVRNLEEWTGIRQVQLPPAEQLTDDQVNRLLKALNDMLDGYNWSFVLQINVPDRIQYETIRINFNQDAKIKRWHMGFFKPCRDNTEHGKCTLGEYCQCAFYSDLFSGFDDEQLTPEEERARELDCEIRHLKNKHGNEWMKYYPYHLDANYDDEDGNLSNNGFDEDEDEDSDWWRT